MAANYFTVAAIAERYAWARPNLHARYNAELLRHTGRLKLAADFGCGTGLSSRALTEIASIVIGLDPSLAMLENAEPHPQVQYCAGLAESPPFADASFDLLTVGVAFHWFDRDRFFAEARRIVLPGGWLFIYNNWFRGTMRDRPDFATWNREQYLVRCPTPERAWTPIPAPDAPEGFTTRTSWNMEVDVPMSRSQFVHYLTTQSNVSAVVDRGDESLAEVTEWLMDSVAPFYHDSEELFTFAGSAWLLQRDPHVST